MPKGTLLFVGNHFETQNINKNVWFEIPAHLSSLGWETIITSQHYSKPLRLLDMLWTILSKRKFYNVALVDVFSGSAFIWAGLSAGLLKLIGKPFVLNLHGGNLPAFSDKYPARVRRVLAAAFHVVSPSPYLQNKLQQFRKDIQVIPNPIEIDRFPFRCRENVKPNLIWVRAFHEIYNPSLAPKVLSYLIEDWPDIHITMVGPYKGDGSLERMKEVAKNLGVLELINLEGGVPREKVPEYLSKGDIFINTTNFDNTPVSVIEAMACGLPIVTTDVGGIPWLVDDGINGLLVPPDDPQAMADAVARILKDPSLSGKLSQNGRRKAERFDWSFVLPQWENLLSQLLTKAS